MKIYPFLLIILISSCAYDPGDKRLEVINHIGSEIIVYWHSDTIPEYPSINDTEVYLRSYSIKSGDSMGLPEHNANWPLFVDNAQNKKLNLFVYAADTIKKYKNIDTVNSRKFYKRLEYSKEQLETINWRVEVK